MPTRRNILMAAAAIPASAACAGAAAAAPAPDAAEHLGIFRARVGGALITAVSDGTSPMSPGLALAAPERVRELAEFSCQSADALESSRNLFLIETAGRKALVDTGMGPEKGVGLGRLFSRVCPADSVTDILITHCHIDHVLGLARDGAAIFPNAVLWAPKKDYEHFSGSGVDETTRSRTIAMFTPYEKAGRLRLFDGETEAVPGIRALQRPGHTPGHVFYELTSEGRKVVFAGDIAHIAAVQFPDPAISVKYDMDPGMAALVRAATFKEMAETGTVFAACHIPFPGIGRIRRHGQGYEFLPLPLVDRPV